MITLSQVKEAVATAYRTDANLNRAKSWVEPVKRRLPSATVDYIVEKLPVAQWLPHYDWRWILQDVIAGITIGVMFIPQGLAYAKIATIPVEHGLYSCWIPATLYFFLGTSKELSAGPTSILGLMTAEIVSDISKEGWDAATIASAVAFSAGIYALVLGSLKLGFLLDYVSAPVLSGWISAVALVILMGQIGSLIGMDVGSKTVQIIRGILGHLDQIQPMTLCIGFTGIAMLWVLEQVGKRWGKKSKWIKFLSTSRAVAVLFIYTLISYLVNRGLDEEDYHWNVTEVDTHGMLAPKTHDSSLISKVIGRSFAPFIAMAVEHLGVGKAFGLKNGYSIDKSQELVFLGVENMVNSLFGAMATGGAMSRTAVNSECGVRSPLNFLFTAGFVILTLYELAPALYWIPKATLSAIIVSVPSFFQFMTSEKRRCLYLEKGARLTKSEIMAVVHLISSPRIFYRYWRMSFIDFVASQLGFWVTLFTTTEIGLAASVGFSLVYTLLRLAFPRWFGTSHADTETNHWFISKIPSVHDLDIPSDVFLVRFTDDLLFPNAERIKNGIIDSIKVQYEAEENSAYDRASIDRSWNVASHSRIDKIRKRKGVTPISTAESPLHYIVLDFTMVPFIDITGVLTLIELKMQVRRYLGQHVQFNFVGLMPPVLERFNRSEWEFAMEGQQRTESTDVLYTSLENAILHTGQDDKLELVQEKTLEV